MSRIIDRYTSEKEGPLLFITAGVHGNEPSGVQALERVFEALNAQLPEIKGTLIGLKGNQKALQEGVRFIDEDLNRTWKAPKIKKVIKDTHEEQEMQEIISILDIELGRHSDQKTYFLDCHTTSSESAPYMSVQVKNDNDPWAQHFPTNIVRGFSDIVSGSIDHYFTDRGLTGFTFEAGSHESPQSSRHHESMIWLMLKEACKLELSSIKQYPECVSSFKDCTQQIFEIVYRHGIEAADDFSMQPGFSNFDPIAKGDLLATQNGKEIRSKWDANIFMPLYQGQGNDGFFVIEKVG